MLYFLILQHISTHTRLNTKIIITAMFFDEHITLHIHVNKLCGLVLRMFSKSRKFDLFRVVLSIENDVSDFIHLFNPFNYYFI